MEYKFKCLVIDDIDDLESRFGYFEETLREDFNLNVEMEFSKNLEKDILRNDYDILLIDFDLSNITDMDGDVIIPKIREHNKIIKIIFYSSKFNYDDNSNTFKFHDVSHDVIYNVINKWKVDRLIPRDNFDLIIKSIKECCEEFDMTLLGLYKSIEKYYNSGINVKYTLNNGTELNNEELINELKSDSKNSKEIRDKIYKYSITNILDFEY